MTKGTVVLRQTFIIKSVITAGLLLTSCSHLTLTPVPTPAPRPVEREPLQMSMNDFASFMAKMDEDSVDSDQYAYAVMEIVACMSETVEFDAQRREFLPGEKATAYWWSIAFLMAGADEQEMVFGDEDNETPMLSWLQAAHEYCTEID